MTTAQQVTHEVIRTQYPIGWKKHLGLEQAVLNAIANHIDSDKPSTGVSFFQDGEVLDFGQVLLGQYDTSKPIEKVVLSDRGNGYSSAYLWHAVSSKEDDLGSIGRFGQGLKIISTVLLREQGEVEFVARNWKANPRSLDTEFDHATLHFLAYDLKVNGSYMEGSATVFKNPSPELVEEILKLPLNVLQFNERYKNALPENLVYETLYRQTKGPLAKEYAPGILDTKDAGTLLFVKGVKFSELDAIFSYDLNVDAISSDRDQVRSEERVSQMRQLLIQCRNSVVLEKILDTAKDRDTYYDDYAALAPGNKIPNAHLWRNAFTKLYGDDAVLACDDEDTNKDLKNPIKLHREVANFLRSCRVKTAERAKEGEQYLWTEDSKLGYRERAILRALSNMEIDGRLPKCVRAYSAVVSTTGKVLSKANDGIHMHDGTIGLKTYLLEGDLRETLRVFIHEMGHDITEAGHYDRKFGVFCERLAAEGHLPRFEQLVDRELSGTTETDVKKDQSTLKKEERLARHVERAYAAQNGDRIRSTVGRVAKLFKDNANDLTKYFGHSDKKLAGIATSAYYQLTGEISPMRMIEYGGLGVTIEIKDGKGENVNGLEFGKKQLHFAKLSGYALFKSVNSDEALWYSQNSGKCLEESQNSGRAGWFSRNSGRALVDSKNTDDSFRYAVNSIMAFEGSKNRKRSLQYTQNSGFALHVSKYYDESGQYSVNRGLAAGGSRMHGKAFKYSSNSGFALAVSLHNRSTLFTRNTMFNYLARYNPLMLGSSLIVHLGCGAVDLAIAKGKSYLAHRKAEKTNSK